MKARRHILSLGLTLCLLLGQLLVPPVTSADPAVEVTIEAPEQVSEDAEFTAKVNISDAENLNAYDFEVAFTPSVLELIDVAPGKIDETSIPVIKHKIEDGKVNIVGHVPGRVSGSGYLAELHFKAIGSVGNTSAITLSDGTLSDWLGNPIEADWTGTTVEIVYYAPLHVGFYAEPKQGIRGSTLHPPTINFTDATTGGKTPYTFEWDFGDESSSTVESPSHTYAPPGTKTGMRYTVKLTVEDAWGTEAVEEKEEYITIYQRGDINLDLTLNAIDITKIELIVAGIQGPTLAADANEDGNINALDITMTELLVVTARD